MKGKQKGRLWRLCLPLTTLPLLGTAVMRAGAAGSRPGDVNLDQFVDVSDAVLMARFIVEDPMAVLDSEGKANADLNEDHLIDGRDLTDLMLGIAKVRLDILYPSVTTTVTTTEITTTTTTTAPAPEDSTELIADSVSYPYDVSLSVLSGQSEPAEMLTAGYQSGNMTFAIFNDQPDALKIAIAHQDNIVGYYLMCSEYSAPKGFKVTEYRDEIEPGANGGLYAVLILRDDMSIQFSGVNTEDGLRVLSKLQYYALNGIRAAKKQDLKPLDWNGNAAKAAEEHSKDMAQKNYLDHIERDDAGHLIYYEFDAGTLHYGKRLPAAVGTDENGMPYHYQVNDDSSPVLDANGNQIILGKWNAAKAKVKETDGYYPGNEGFRLNMAGIDWSHVGENVEFGSAEPFFMLNGWLNSASHRQHIFTKKDTAVGIGIAGTSDGKRFYGTQVFFDFF